MYLCTMKREIGKWFMDVAKYIATAVLLTQIFGGMADSTMKTQKEERRTKIKRTSNERNSSNFDTFKCNGNWMLAFLPYF